MSLTRRYDFGLSLIRDAGELALGYFNNRTSLSIQSKGPQDMASEADLNTELLIKSRLAGAFPEDAFLGEETGRTAFAKDQGIWVVDPIDGTQPFICGLSSWCVSIAFVRGGALQFGMVYAPARDELFAGGAGHAATLNGQPIRGAPCRFRQGRADRRRLFAEERHRSVSPGLRAVPARRRHVLPRRFGCAGSLLCGGRPAHRLLRTRHQGHGIASVPLLWCRPQASGPMTSWQETVSSPETRSSPGTTRSTPSCRRSPDMPDCTGP